MPGSNRSDRDQARQARFNSTRWKVAGRSLWQPSDGLYLQRVVILALVYGLVAHVAVSLPGVHTIGASVWPGAGIAQALLLLWGWRVWPGIALGIFLFDLIDKGDTLPVLAFFGIAGATLQTLLAFWLCRRFRMNPKLHKISDVFKLLLFGALIATQISCSFGSLALFWEGKIPWEEVASVRWSWWLGDTLGVIVFAPAVLLLSDMGGVWRRWLRWLRSPNLRKLTRRSPTQLDSQTSSGVIVSRPRRRVRKNWTREIWIQSLWVVCLLGASLFVFFSRPSPAIAYYPLEYIPLPLILWASLRLGPQETVLSALLVSMIAIAGTSQGLGPFSVKAVDKPQTILLLQAFLGVITITALLMAAAVSERDLVMNSLRRSEQRYKSLSKDLEQRVIQRTQELQEQQQQSDYLLLNILPQAIADQLKQRPNQIIAETFDQVTVLFADIVQFTEFAATVSPQQLVSLLNQIISDFDRLTEAYGLEKIKTIGDEYMVVGGLPTPNPNQVQAMAELALAMQDAIRNHIRPDGRAFQLRIGIHCGNVVAGVIGVKKFAYDLWGDTVNLASRLETSSSPGGIQVSEAVYEKLSDRFLLKPRGEIDLKGKGFTRTYWLVGTKESQVSGVDR
ncbi:MAG: adenylate/guanylate cyclase domain-containing protein [Cyanobacteria bacterium P01_D01_bin.73]